MDIEIRRAKIEDLEVLVDLLEELFLIEEDFQAASELQRRGLQLLLKSKRARIWVAELDGTVAGMCSVQRLISTAEGGYVGLIEDVIVQKKYRGLGMGRSLLKAVEDHAVQEGWTRLQLLADSHNGQALKFYEKEAWQQTQMVCLRKKQG